MDDQKTPEKPCVCRVVPACFLTAALAGWSLAHASAADPPVKDAKPAAAARSPVETALAQAAGIQYAAYAELLAMFSAEGTAPLLSRRVDLGTDDPKTAVANYRRLTDLTDRMIAAEAEFQAAVKTIADQTGLPVSDKGTLQNAVGWHLQLQSLLPVMQTSLLQSDLLYAGWKFWKYAENARRTARATVLGVAFADAEEHRLQKPEQEMMRRHIYEVARTRYADKGDIGGSELEFFENLRDGKLDHIAQRLHADMSQAGNLEGLAYMTIAGVQGKRPIDIVYEEGCRGLAAGVDLYIAAGKAVVAGGLGPEAGEKFLEGFDKGVEIVEKIQEMESQVQAVQELVRDPIGYMQEKVPQVLQERAVELLKEKTGLSDTAIEECTDLLGEAVQQVVQNVEYSRRINEAYDKDRFLMELAKERGDKPAPPDTILQPTAAEGARLRRITQQVHEEMAAEGWNLGTVEIDIRATGGGGHDAVRSALDSVVVWWKDARANATRLTILPAPVLADTAVGMPDGAQVELIELTGSGAIHRLTERPVVMSGGGHQRVVVWPPIIEAPRDKPAVRRDQAATPRPETPARAAIWPNPEVFLPPGLHRIRVSGDYCLVQANPPRPMAGEEAPEWQGKDGAYQLIYRYGGLPVFQTAHLYIRPFATDEGGSAVDVGSTYRFRGVDWGPMKSLAADEGVFFTQRGGIGIAVVSAGGYLAVVREINWREDAPLLRQLRLEFLRTIRDRLQRAGRPD